MSVKLKIKLQIKNYNYKKERYVYTPCIYITLYLNYFKITKNLRKKRDKCLFYLRRLIVKMQKFIEHLIFHFCCPYTFYYIYLLLSCIVF